jgi:N-acetylglucosaminyldiphosphoundecaprenol N-acetyl-beta-D-mannosaminyltransferase
MKVFGVSINYGSREEILAQLKGFLDEPKFHRIATVNPEFLVMAERRPDFKRVLLAADLCVADGFGIVLISWLEGKKITRFTGADLMQDVLALSQDKGSRVFLSLKHNGLSSYTEIRAALLKKYPRLSVDGCDLPMRDMESWTARLGRSEVVLCNFGAPRQELFLERLRTSPGALRLAIGVGGSFDFLTEKLPRAPRVVRAYGLEWLWRLVLQPKRWRRIWDAVAVFPALVALSKVHRDRP